MRVNAASTRPGRLQKRVTHYANRHNCGTTQHSVFCEKNTRKRGVSCQLHTAYILYFGFTFYVQFLRVHVTFVGNDIENSALLPCLQLEFFN